MYVFVYLFILVSKNIIYLFIYTNFILQVGIYLFSLVLVSVLDDDCSHFQKL